MIPKTSLSANGKKSPWASSPFAEEYDHLARSGYPWFKATSGRIHFVDSCGVIEGLWQLGPSQGKRRIDCPGEAPPLNEIAGTIRWIEARGLVPIKTPTLSSYRAKHLAERWRRDYVSNGAAIIAFDRLGFRQSVDPCRATLNTTIAVLRKSYRDLPEFLGEHGGGR